MVYLLKFLDQFCIQEGEQNVDPQIGKTITTVGSKGRPNLNEKCQKLDVGTYG